MPWYAVYEVATGRLASTGTVLDADDAALATRGLAKKEYVEEIQVPTKVWNEGTQDFDTIPMPKPKIDTIDFWKRFTQAEREDIFEAAQTNKAVRGFVQTYRSVGSVRMDDPENGLLNPTLAARTQIGTSVTAAGIYQVYVGLEELVSTEYVLIEVETLDASGGTYQPVHAYTFGSDHPDQIVYSVPIVSPWGWRCYLTQTNGTARDFQWWFAQRRQHRHFPCNRGHTQHRDKLGPGRGIDHP
jgi:hypothetical protein